MYLKDYYKWHTFSRSLKLLGSHCCLHHSSVWPLKCILSITIVVSAICFAVGVRELLTGFVANFFR